ncbi:hypothetical protein PISMIDRAFT_12860 [Pisolithus microcarpus 441]|uniref:Uncharacterized protein n=1 Tax=Pisolithus microcarpus 441 TaxID=765257 RepID=A0A0C9ZKZ4_9AGAM|nr:hypothetical protein PISMIDRAFT_12860 [Pisolithus microcarpus 441]
MAEVTFSQTCVCGQMFSDLGAFTCHEKGCCKGKKRLASALEKVKQVYQRKKARLSVARAISESDNTGIELASTFDADQVHGFQLAESTLQQHKLLQDDDLPLAQRRAQHTNCQLPL